MKSRQMKLRVARKGGRRTLKEGIVPEVEQGLPENEMPQTVDEAVLYGMKQLVQSVTDDGDKLLAFLEESGDVEAFTQHFRDWIEDLKTFQNATLADVGRG